MKAKDLKSTIEIIEELNLHFRDVSRQVEKWDEPRLALEALIKLHGQQQEQVIEKLKRVKVPRGDQCPK